MQIPGGGSPGGGGGEGLGGCLQRIGELGGGLIVFFFFFRGRNAHQEKDAQGFLEVKNLEDVFGSN